MSVLTTVPDRSQAVPSRRNGDSRINMPSWIPRKTHASLAPQAQARPTCSTAVTGFQVPIQTWTLSSHTWGPASKWCLDLHLSLSPISRSGKSRSPWQESNKSFRYHKQVCAQDNKSVTWPGSMQRTVLNRHGQENSATKLCPVAAEHNLLHPPVPIPYPCPVTISFPSFHHECNNNNNHLLWVTTGYSCYR
jgi:hypothetical protein